MPSNVEIKARIGDYETLERRAAELSDGAPDSVTQRDVFFNAPRGRLKLRFLDDGTGELIYYERPDSSGPATSRYVCFETAAPARLEELLSMSHGARATVRKRRRIYHAGQTRIHLDRVDGLGDFVELEVVLRDGQGPGEGSAIARQMMEALGIEKARLIDVAYVDLLTRSRDP